MDVTYLESIRIDGSVFIQNTITKTTRPVFVWLMNGHLWSTLRQLQSCKLLRSVTHLRLLAHFRWQFYRAGFTKSLQAMPFLALPSILTIIWEVVSFCKFPNRCQNIQAYHFVEFPISSTNLCSRTRSVTPYDWQNTRTGQTLNYTQFQTHAWTFQPNTWTDMTSTPWITEM